MENFIWALVVSVFALACNPESVALRGAAKSISSETPSPTTGGEDTRDSQIVTVAQSANSAGLFPGVAATTDGKGRLTVEPTVLQEGKEIPVSVAKDFFFDGGVSWDVAQVSGDAAVTVNCPDVKKLVLLCQLTGVMTSDRVLKFVARFSDTKQPTLTAFYLIKSSGAVAAVIGENRTMLVDVLDLDLEVTDLPVPNLCSSEGSHMARVCETAASRFCRRKFGAAGGQVSEISLGNRQAAVTCISRGARLLRVAIKDILADTSLPGCKVNFDDLASPVGCLALAGRYCRTSVRDASGEGFAGGTWQEWLGNQGVALLLCVRDRVNGTALRQVPFSVLNKPLNGDTCISADGHGSDSFLRCSAMANRHCIGVASEKKEPLVSGLVQEISEAADDSRVLCL